MSDLEIKIEGLDEMKRRFLQAPKIVGDALNTGIKKAIFILLGEARKRTPVDRGFLRNAAMNTIFSNLKGTLENTAPYAWYVHGDGTKDRTTPHFPPLSAVAPWAARHGIPAFLVAKSIARKGTPFRPFFAEAIASQEVTVSSIFREALNTITSHLAA